MPVLEPPRRVGLSHLMLLVIGYMLARPLMRFMYRLRIERDRRWQRGAACVLACNHRSFMDPPLVSQVSRRPVSYFARANLWRNPLIRWWLDVLGGVPIDRDEPALQSMKQAVRLLRDGRTMLIFPEGTRTRTGRVGRLRAGPALFARRAGVPVVPCYLHGSETAWPRGWPIFVCHGKVRLRIGRPIPVPPNLTGRTADAFVTRYLQDWMERQERELVGRR